MGNPQSYYHYLPVSDQAMQWGIYLTGAGRGTIEPNSTYPPPSAHPQLYDFTWDRGRTLPEFQLILLTEGSGEFESDAVDLQKFGDAVIIFLTPGVWHRYRPNPKTGWHERWISFNGRLAHHLCDLRLLQPKGFLVHAIDCRDLALRFDELLDRIHADPVQNSVLMSFHGMSLIGDAIEHASRTTPQSLSNRTDASATSDSLVDQALDIIWTRSHSPISVVDVARQLNVNRRTLDRRFSAATGHSVLHEIGVCRLSRARRLLVETELPIKLVAYLSGYSSKEQMRTSFQASEGVSPKEYRENSMSGDPSSP